MNEKKHILRNKTFSFALRIVNIFKYLQLEKKEFILSKQLLRSGTSIGANVREAYNAESKNDFIHKLAISQKETDESMYWLELLKESKYLSEEEFISIHFDASEILKMLRSSILTSKSNQRLKNL